MKTIKICTAFLLMAIFGTTLAFAGSGTASDTPSCYVKQYKSVDFKNRGTVYAFKVGSDYFMVYEETDSKSAALSHAREHLCDGEAAAAKHGYLSIGKSSIDDIFDDIDDIWNDLDGSLKKQLTKHKYRP